MREAWIRLCGSYQSKGGLLAVKEVRKVRLNMEPVHSVLSLRAVAGNAHARSSGEEHAARTPKDELSSGDAFEAAFFATILVTTSAHKPFSISEAASLLIHTYPIFYRH